ncbi:MAG: YtxH domain-containing protein [Bacteroidales bacterium]|jgi:gas vesicle protein|nr:YtxH domain-containing protein [Bacteroidales bacterium]MBQ9712662.1 YtxH domain-containing protein [Bacteroidales bacterium]MBR6414492.1 YtxH domain-containing protein [Bacteroidales bacterium]
MKAESLFALLSGVAAGAILGILFAPDKGEETREKIKKAASEGYDNLKDITEETAHDLHVRARYARKEMNALKKTLAEQGASFKEDAKAKILEQLDRLEKALAKEEEIIEEQDTAEA